jgi:predicted CopG family antitoxin
MCKQLRKTIRVASITYKDLEKLGNLGDKFDSVIRRLLTSQSKTGGGLKSE